jgi:NADH dehydrogenase
MPSRLPTARPRVLVIGAGFGGLEAVRALARAPVDVILLDARNHHCFQPLLYQVATAALSPADVAWPVRAILRRQRNAQVLMARVDAVDTGARTVRAAGLSLPYDYLVIATGATHSYFGHEEWSKDAPGLKTIEDATSIRRRILLAFEHAELADDPALRQRLLTFVIVGGGPTGVEMAGAIAEVAFSTLARDFRRIDTSTARIVLLEAGPTLLSAFPPDLSAYARQALEKMGVEVMTSTAVLACEPDGVVHAGGRIPAGAVIWAAGVRASPAASWLGVEADRQGRIKVDERLRVPGHANVFAIGDTAAADGPDGRPVPGVAPAAKQMGHYVGRQIAALAAGGPATAAFAYRHQGDLATIGRKSAVVRLGRLRLTGFVGWVFWGVAHIYFLIGARNRLVVTINWLWNYVTFQRGARLITRVAGDDGSGR